MFLFPWKSNFHDEVGPSVRVGTGVEDPGDVGVIHQRERLALGFEPGDYLPAVHARLDNLQRHVPPNRLELLSAINRRQLSQSLRNVESRRKLP